MSSRRILSRTGKLQMLKEKKTYEIMYRKLEQRYDYTSLLVKSKTKKKIYVSF